ncbi:P-loop containing nucleoside triphosphate hydrolase protein [Cantharellus anzutake]|uniref:P-loop containing nucleoside triphosphate hydrolase protein n=1 Tax=Cantharellus anzutake TaxID=1750568 RepID=UPI001908D9EC|nr:P-loop containing nucleoside triphosphate hydrolase protein [Cantharellus anzutake]KAF8334002.1 P-loop containing nucleoside triphosphate hydrolase protein [Cantharellus anzutake]
MAPPPLFEVRGLSWSKTGEKSPFLSDINFTLNPGDIIALTGKSGSGKSTLLKCLAHLNLYEGEVLLHGKTPKACGVPKYRTKVLYIPQRPAILPSTPIDFLKKVLALASRSTTPSAEDPEENLNSAQYIASRWNIDEELWHRKWVTLSGGEAQRIAMAIGLSMQGTEILLLDEPTSALDQGSVDSVERYVAELPSTDHSSIKAIIWITHSEDQAKKIATRRIRVENGTATEIA